MTDQLTIVLDPTAANDWLEIDAIKLMGRTQPKGKSKGLYSIPLLPKNG